MDQKHVIIVGAGFAGLGCARKLAKEANVHVTLIDKNNFHQFQPLLYQVATSELGAIDVAYSLRIFFESNPNIDIKMAEVVSIDPNLHSVSTATGETYKGDFLVLAAGSEANFFGTEGAKENSFPLYSLDDADRLRSRILAVFEDADRNPKLIERGALNFVIVGAGPTGTEMAGALADMINEALPKEYLDLMVKEAKVYLVDHNKAVLSAFSEKARQYAAKQLEDRGVQLHLGLLVKEVAPGYVLLSDGSKILTHTAIWAGGLKAAPLASHSNLPQGHGGRINVLQDLTVEGFQGIYALGDFANIPSPDGKAFPQLGSVALQCGHWAAKNILADIAGNQREPFDYHDKGIMAMIGRNAAVAEIGKKRHELEGFIAFAAWLGVHAALLSGVRQRIEAFVEWAWDYFGRTRSIQVLDRTDAAHIDWSNEGAAGKQMASSERK